MTCHQAKALWTVSIFFAMDKSVNYKLKSNITWKILQILSADMSSCFIVSRLGPRNNMKLSIAIPCLIKCNG